MQIDNFISTILSLLECFGLLMTMINLDDCLRQ